MDYYVKRLENVCLENVLAMLTIRTVPKYSFFSRDIRHFSVNDKRTD